MAKPKRERGRPKGVTQPCGWGCGKLLTASEVRAHFVECPNRPGGPKTVAIRLREPE